MHLIGRDFENLNFCQIEKVRFSPNIVRPDRLYRDGKGS